MTTPSRTNAAAAALVAALNAHAFGESFTARRVCLPVLSPPAAGVWDVAVWVPSAKWDASSQSANQATPTVTVEIRRQLTDEADPAGLAAVDLVEEIACWALDCPAEEDPTGLLAFCVSAEAENLAELDELTAGLVWATSLSLTYGPLG